MNKMKLTAGYAFIIGLSTLLFTACEKPFDRDENNFYKEDLPMNGSQVVPANTSSATGKMKVNYNKGTHLLDYTITWSGLSGPPASGATSIPGVTFPAIGVYGLADPTYMAFPAPPLAQFPGGVVQSITSGFPAATSGTYTGQLYVDNVVIKESDVLNNKFYIMVRTATYINGQIRGQIDFR